MTKTTGNPVYILEHHDCTFWKGMSLSKGCESILKFSGYFILD